MPNDCSPRNRQRGFTLIVIFLLVILMVGMAATVLMSSQTDLQIAGQDRESTIAFYAAETGIAYGKDWLSANSHGAPGPSAWNAILNSNVAQLCGPNPNLYQPGVVPQTLRQPYDFNAPQQIFYNFCIHNNPLDPSWAGGFGSKVDGDGVITWTWITSREQPQPDFDLVIEEARKAALKS